MGLRLTLLALACGGLLALAVAGPAAAQGQTAAARSAAAAFVFSAQETQNAIVKAMDDDLLTQRRRAETLGTQLAAARTQLAAAQAGAGAAQGRAVALHFPSARRAPPSLGGARPHRSLAVDPLLGGQARWAERLVWTDDQGVQSMTTVDQWAILKEHAARAGQDALALVERVGPERAQYLFWDMARRFSNDTAAAFYGPRVYDRWTLYEILEQELRRIDDEDMGRHRRQYDPDRLNVPSEQES
jgi:hypothetical protein